MNSVPTQEMCPMCREKKNPNRLNLMLATQELFCTDPKTGKQVHGFTDLAAVYAYNGAPAATEPPAATPEAYDHTIFEEPTETPVEAPNAKQELDPLPTNAQAKPEPEERRDPEPTAVTKAVGTVLKERREPEIPQIPQIVVPPLKKFVPPPARKMIGGDLIVTLRVPERHVNFLEGARVSRGTPTLEQFMQEEIERAMDDRWFY